MTARGTGRRGRALLSARLRLALSYAGVVVLVAAVLLAAVALFLLRYVPEEYLAITTGPRTGYGAPNRATLIQAFVPRAVQALILCLAIGLVGGWFLAGRMLRPLRVLDVAAERVAAGDLSHRIEVRGPRDEFGRLADTFDDMAGRVEDMVRRQERFAANASHELRTPLAAARALLDTARTDDDHDTDAALRRVDEILVRAGETTEALLLLSRISPEVPLDEDVDLSLTAEDAAETVAIDAARRGVELLVDAEAAWTRGSAPLIRQIALNLVGNAIVHNASHGGWVRVATGLRGSHAILQVSNSGPHVPLGIVPELVEPFRTGTGRLQGADGRRGVGLGLSVVRAIAEIHGAPLTITPREEGGLVVELAFAALAPGATES